MQAQHAQVMAGLLELNVDDKADKQNHSEGQHAQRSRWSRGRRFLVGHNTDDAHKIQTIPRSIALHVTRLHPDTKPDDLRRLLKGKFPEVECVSHPSQFPEKYASMKVSILKENFAEAWKRESLPKGVLV